MILKNNIFFDYEQHFLLKYINPIGFIYSETPERKIKFKKEDSLKLEDDNWKEVV